MQDHELEAIKYVWDKLNKPGVLTGEEIAYMTGRLEQLLSPYIPLKEEDSARITPKRSNFINDIKVKVLGE